ncbi:MAG: MFS transporter [Dehalococcoidia bacterium]
MTRRSAGIARLIAASGISWSGDWALTTAASVAVFRETGSTAAVSLLLALAAIPAVILAPLAGAVADRHDRRKIMLSADLASAVVLLALLPALGTGAELPAVYAAVLALGIFATFHRPASEALLPSLAPPAQLSRANSALRLAQRLGFIGGPAAGAWLIDRGGLETVFVVDAVTFFVSSLIIAAIPRVRASATGATESTFRAAAAGFRYARDQRNLRIVIISVGITMLVAPIVNAGTVVFVADELEESESWYGWLLAAQGIGAIAFAAALIVLGPRTRLLPTGFIALVVTGSSVLLLATSASVAPAIVAMVTMGMGVVGLQVAFASYLQREAHDAYRGRIMGLVATVASIGNLVGLAITPLAVLALGVRPAFAVAGAIIILSALPILSMLRNGSASEVAPAADRASSRP